MDATRSRTPDIAAATDGDTLASQALRAGAAADARAIGWSERKAAGAVRAALFGDAPKPLVPRYRLDRVLGRGAMGEVWQAHDPRLHRDVAVKLILPRLEGDADATRRVAREARALARLTHPNVVAVYDVGSYDGPNGRGTFIVMELVVGEPLDAWLARRKRSLAEILDVFCQAGEGLAAAHAVGIVHRDFKPSNVLVGADGRARVGDFGLARALDQSDDGAPTVDVGPALLGEVGDTLAGTLTATGTVMGTPLYMAPEQHDGRATDARADQYAFCTSLFEAVFRRRPFLGGIADLAAAKAVGPQLTAAEQRATSVRIHDAILRGMAPRIEDRHASMQDLLAALAADRTRRKGRFAVGGIVALALVGVPFAATTSGSRCPPLAELDDDDQRRRLPGALASTLDGAQIAGVVQRVEQLRATIADEHTAACSVDPELSSPHAACVQSAARHFAAALGVLLEHDVTATQAHDVLDATPDIRSCVEAGDEGDDVDHAIAQRLAAANALHRAGRSADALRVVTELREDLDARGDHVGRDAAWVRSTLAIASKLLALHRSREGVAEFEAAYLDAVAAGFDGLAFEAARQLAIEYASRGEFSDADRWAAHATAAHGALATARQRPWELDFMRGVIAYYHWDHDNAATLLQRVIAACEARECGDILALARRNLARSYSMSHQYGAARAAWADERARAIAKYGPDAPHAIEAELFETVASASDDLGAAQRRLQALADRLERTDPLPDPRLLGMVRVDLAELSAKQGDATGALAIAKQAADALATEPGLVELRMVALARAAEYAEALGDTAAVDALQQAAVEADDAPNSRMQTLTQRAARLAASGRYAESLADAEAARDIAREHFPAASAEIAKAESNVVFSLALLERCGDALAQSDVALAAWEAASDDAAAPALLRDVHLARAMCHERAGSTIAAAIDYRAAVLLGGADWPGRAMAEGRVVALEQGLPKGDVLPGVADRRPPAVDANARSRP